MPPAARAAQPSPPAAPGPAPPTRRALHVTADEVADVVGFLASPRSVAITGDAVVAGGGNIGPIHY
jgi:hypothetical protein